MVKRTLYFPKSDPDRLQISKTRTRISLILQKLKQNQLYRDWVVFSKNRFNNKFIQSRAIFSLQSSKQNIWMSFNFHDTPGINFFLENLKSNNNYIFILHK